MECQNLDANGTCMHLSFIAMLEYDLNILGIYKLNESEQNSYYEMNKKLTNTNEG